MEQLEQFIEKMKTRFSEISQKLLLEVFGQNNERLDFLLDSFNKLQPNQQRGALAGSALAFFLMIMLGIWIYAAQVGSLRTELSDSFSTLRQFRSLANEFGMENTKFTLLVDSVKGKVDATSYKPYLDQLAKKNGLSLGQLDERDIAATEDSPLGKELRDVAIDVNFDNVSLPRLLKFLTEIEKSGKYLRIDDLRIRSRYGTKLFFDAKVLFRAYKPA
ncbi:MAG: hypothetical protein WCI18_08355 [Pseudomonadota bacterium]